MASKDELNIFVNPEEKLFEVELPIITTPYAYKAYKKDVLESKEFLLVKLFKYLRSFYILLKEVRKDLKIHAFIEFPELFTLDSYIGILKKINPDIINKLNKWCKIIEKRYSLLENWEIPIKTVILTHHFPIPYPKVPISYFIPLIDEEKKREQERTKTLRIFSNVFDQARNFTRTWEVTLHPAIYFNSKVSPTSLIKWIEENTDFFKMINKRLPEETSATSKMVVRTQKIGEFVLSMKWGREIRWKDMQKIADEWDKEEDNDNYWDEEGNPTSEDCRIAWKSYFSVITKLESGDSESL